MKIETVQGAVIAALITFLTAIAALFQNDADLTWAQISTSAWVSVGSGALIQLLKDYQAVSTRRFLAKLQGGEYEEG